VQAPSASVGTSVRARVQGCFGRISLDCAPLVPRITVRKWRVSALLAWDAAPALAGSIHPSSSRLRGQIASPRGDFRKKTSVQVKSSDPRPLGVDTVRLPPYLVSPGRRSRWSCGFGKALHFPVGRQVQAKKKSFAAWLTPGRTCSLGSARPSSPSDRLAEPSGAKSEGSRAVTLLGPSIRQSHLLNS
jgi:hypothetical protein